MNTIKDNPTLCGLINAVIDITSDEIDIVMRWVVESHEYAGYRDDRLDALKERIDQRTREVVTAAYQAGVIDGQIKINDATVAVLRSVITDDGPDDTEAHK